MNSLGNLRHIVALVVVVVLGIGVYFLATRVDFFAGPTARISELEEEVTRIEVELLEPLNRLNAVVLDERVFMSEEFQELQDQSVPLDAPALERSNPFAPF